MAKRTVIIAGATGMVGRAILDGLLADDAVTEVHCLGRRPPPTTHPKLRMHVVNFASIPVLPQADEVYLALGTTIKVAGSQQAFRAIDYDANLAVARAAQAAGVTKLGLVSAMGADASASVFYNRVKGELEEALEKMSFAGLVIARPSLLVGDREALGQPARRGEKLGLALSKVLSFLIPANYQPIAAAAVAKALLTAVPQAQGKNILLSGAMH
ncbi:NAD(P)H-binding protein [Undibacterium umbellatum]|uniref:NAD(P)H-binding protein n=1 Tax=Undibacterium umbellatum TaxID=2762300 RepID=A0ABR6ZEC6_9BURK|nr:NAD(P)H-binding protein [Undibacterium umbellatum]MBC3909685.1 NAD(P)H-binding protein [Undibacterium umbellatum]